MSLKLHEHWGGYWRKKLPWMILEEQFPVPRNTAASKIGNSVISLLWQLRCHCNPDHNKFHLFSNTTVVAIFPTLCLWRRSLCSNLGGIGLEKLYRATLNHFTFGGSVGSHPHPTLLLKGYDRERVTRKRKAPIDRLPVQPIRTKKEKSDTEKRNNVVDTPKKLLWYFTVLFLG